MLYFVDLIILFSLLQISADQGPHAQLTAEHVALDPAGMTRSTSHFDNSTFGVTLLGDSNTKLVVTSSFGNLDI